MPPLRVHLLVFVQRFPYPSVFRVLIVWFVTALCKRGYWPLEHWDLGWRPTQVMNICPRLICRIVTGPATAKALPRSPRKNAEKWFEDVAENILDKGLGLERTNMPKHTHAPMRTRASFMTSTHPTIRRHSSHSLRPSAHDRNQPLNRNNLGTVQFSPHLYNIFISLRFILRLPISHY
jgi:hypothetical protein